MNLAGIDEGYRGGRRGGGTSHVPTPARVSIAGVSSTSPKTRTGTTIHTVMDSLGRDLLTSEVGVTHVGDPGPQHLCQGSALVIQT